MHDILSHSSLTNPNLTTKKINKMTSVCEPFGTNNKSEEQQSKNATLNHNFATSIDLSNTTAKKTWTMNRRKSSTMRGGCGSPS